MSDEVTEMTNGPVNGGSNPMYSEVAEMTYGSMDGNGDANGKHEMAPMISSSSTTSSDTNQEKRSIFTYLFQNFPSVIIVVLLAIIFALAGQKASGSELDENEFSTKDIKWRPCQVYMDPKQSNFVIYQTSIADPSNQWGEVSCLVRNSKHSPNNKIIDDSQWSWLFGMSSGEAADPLEYGMSSAVIRTNFQEVAHPTREPIMGFGGAFTEASSLNFNTLDENGRDAVLELLFGKSGLGYNLGRVPMNSCDFSPKSYNFDNFTDDFDLVNFDMGVEHDVKSGMIGLMLDANKILKSAWPEDHLQIFTSPWSPPAWMKTPQDPDEIWNMTTDTDMTGSHQPTCLKNGTGKESKYAKAWALYFSKFLTAYKEQGIDLFAVTVQNEPEFPAPWEACAYDIPNESRFVANHLGPTLRRDHPDVKLLIFDHNKDHVVHWGTDLLDAKSPASKYIDGTAVHWYAGGVDREIDGAVGSPNMHRYVGLLNKPYVKDDHIFLGSEACHCPSTGYAGGDLDIAWGRAERYAHTILSDLAAGSNGWVEWNLLLDSIGGPNHIGNLCDAPLLAVPHRANGKHGVDVVPDFEHTPLKFGPVIGDRRTSEELNAMGNPSEYLEKGVVVQPMYYYMGHISRHVRPGSRAVHALVDQPEVIAGSRAFRKGSFVGGGINDLGTSGIEVTLWPCEGSTRQQWTFNATASTFEIYGHNWLDLPRKSCLGKEPDQDYNGILTGDCENSNVTATFKKIVLDENLSIIKLVAQNANSTLYPDGKNCLSVLPLKNNGGAYGPRGGAQVTTGDCDDPASIWKYDEAVGEISSTYFGEDTCLTTGWPFLQANSFVDKTGKKKTMIVLNEARDPANYIVRGDEGEILLTNSIPARSIQTIKF